MTWITSIFKVSLFLYLFILRFKRQNRFSEGAMYCLKLHITVTVTQSNILIVWMGQQSGLAVSTGPLARGHLIWCLGHRVWHSADIHPKSLAHFSQKPKLKGFKILNSGDIYDCLFWATWMWSSLPKFVSYWPKWSTNFQNLTTSLVVIVTSLCINLLKCYVLSRRPTVQLR